MWKMQMRSIANFTYIALGQLGHCFLMLIQHWALIIPCKSIGSRPYLLTSRYCLFVLCSIIEPAVTRLIVFFEAIIMTRTANYRDAICVRWPVSTALQVAYPSKHKAFVWLLKNVGPTSKTLGRRCINVIQMFCVCWDADNAFWLFRAELSADILLNLAAADTECQRSVTPPSRCTPGGGQWDWTLSCQTVSGQSAGHSHLTTHWQDRYAEPTSV